MELQPGGRPKPVTVLKRLVAGNASIPERSQRAGAKIAPAHENYLAANVAKIIFW